MPRIMTSMLSLIAFLQPSIATQYSGDIYHNNHTQLAFSLPMSALDQQQQSDFFVGNSFFKKNWVASPASTSARDGLGPHFIARSCSSCHFMDGRAQPDHSNTGLQLKISIQSNSIDHKKGHTPVPFYGSVLTTKAVNPLTPKGRFFVEYEKITGAFKDATPYELLMPNYHIEWNHKPPETDVMISPRISPHIIGLGLLESVDNDFLLALADPNDADNDGISGKINWVWDHKKNKKAIGKFGWKASSPTIEQQVASALIGDIGITNPLFTENECSAESQPCNTDENLEINDELLKKLVIYSSGLAIPQPRKLKKSLHKQGKKLFDKALCSSCHLPQLVTASQAEMSTLSNQTFYPYTDLLLHDMGEGLSDHRKDFLAEGNEWRTPPLWGIGLFKVVNKHMRLLHDGRARNISEAILWHGGEAEQSKKSFLSMTKKQRTALIKFIESL